MFVIFRCGCLINEGKISYFWDMEHNKPKKLTTHDVAFGIGRKATSEELKELLSHATGTGKDIDQVRAEIKENLKQKRNKKKAL
jgi:hypothetical protein